MATETEKIMGQYSVQRELFQRLGSKLQPLLDSLLQDIGAQVLFVDMRVKEENSLRRKIASKPDQYSALSDITDILGLRVVTYRSGEVDSIAEVVSQEFNIDPNNSIDKRAALADDQFGYLSLHYVANLNQERLSLPEYRPFAACKFEIQIRSVLQHTWAEIEHDIGYKPGIELPVGMRRRFSRIAGLLEVADEEFNRIVIDLERYRTFRVKGFSWQGEDVYALLEAKECPVLIEGEKFEIRRPPYREPLAIALHVGMDGQNILCKLVDTGPFLGSLLQIIRSHRDVEDVGKNEEWEIKGNKLLDGVAELVAVLVGRTNDHD
ncbi:MAG: hypothetical protein M3Y56_04845 [Armatimonadota bacterium]|nr:hypothetical protein [Armatimonadota bacterium]